MVSSRRQNDKPIEPPATAPALEGGYAPQADNAPLHQPITNRLVCFALAAMRAHLTIRVETSLHHNHLSSETINLGTFTPPRRAPGTFKKIGNPGGIPVPENAAHIRSAKRKRLNEVPVFGQLHVPRA